VPHPLEYAHSERGQATEAPHGEEERPRTLRTDSRPPETQPERRASDGHEVDQEQPGFVQLLVHELSFDEGLHFFLIRSRGDGKCKGGHSRYVSLSKTAVSGRELTRV